MVFIMAFLVFEGVDGSGKSSLIKDFSAVLNKKGIAFVMTREPGGTEVGREIRSLLLKKRRIPPLPSVETLLYYADRKQNVDQVIKPALQRGKWVLSDRYWASTSAFQCGGRAEKESFVNFLKEWICEECHPDLWVLLDLPVEESLKRLKKRTKNPDRFEMENRKFHQEVRNYYLKLARRDRKRWLVLDARLPRDRTLSILTEQLEKGGFFSAVENRPVRR